MSVVNREIVLTHVSVNILPYIIAIINTMIVTCMNTIYALHSWARAAGVVWCLIVFLLYILVYETLSLIVEALVLSYYTYNN